MIIQIDAEKAFVKIQSLFIKIKTQTKRRQFSQTKRALQKTIVNSIFNSKLLNAFLLRLRMRQRYLAITYLFNIILVVLAQRNSLTLLKTIKECLIKWKDVPCSWIRECQFTWNWSIHSLQFQSKSEYVVWRVCVYVCFK